MDPIYVQGLRDAKNLLDDGVLTLGEFDQEKARLRKQRDEREDEALSTAVSRPETAIAKAIETPSPSRNAPPSGRIKGRTSTGSVMMPLPARRKGSCASSSAVSSPEKVAEPPETSLSSRPLQPSSAPSHELIDVVPSADSESHASAPDHEESHKPRPTLKGGVTKLAEIRQGTTEVVLQKVKENWHSIEYAAEEKRNERVIVEAAVKQGWQAFMYASDQLRADRELAALACSHDGRALKYASEELRRDKSFVMESDWKALEFASDDVREDPEVLLRLIQQSAAAFEYAGDKTMGASQDFMTRAVGIRGEMLRYATDAMRADRKLVHQAVEQTWEALQWASHTLQGDREIVLCAAKQDHRALKWVSEQLLGDRGAMLEAVKYNGGAIEYISRDLMGDREVVFTAVQSNWQALKFAGYELSETRGQINPIEMPFKLNYERCICSDRENNCK